MLYNPLKHNIIYNPSYALHSKTHTGTQLGFLILIAFYPPPSSCFISRRFKRRSRVSLGDARLALSMTPDQRISFYTTPNRLSLKVVKGLDLQSVTYEQGGVWSANR
ncbi:hypothetical protein HanRHA438_Chr16g0779521 [Helianthus annuus]|nr:hypothetical protein HanRHA438_Chr16g0779521 [Helianthus annuus]